MLLSSTTVFLHRYFNPGPPCGNTTAAAPARRLSWDWPQSNSCKRPCFDTSWCACVLTVVLHWWGWISYVDKCFNQLFLCFFPTSSVFFFVWLLCWSLRACVYMLLPSSFLHMYYKVFWTGNIESAGKAHMVKKMKQGQSFGLMPGGFHELNLFETNKERVYVKKQGFIKYALQYGYDNLSRKCGLICLITQTIKLLAYDVLHYSPVS